MWTDDPWRSIKPDPYLLSFVILILIIITTIWAFVQNDKQQKEVDRVLSKYEVEYFVHEESSYCMILIKNTTTNKIAINETYCDLIPANAKTTEFKDLINVRN